MSPALIFHSSLLNVVLNDKLYDKPELQREQNAIQQYQLR
jgi:hypothetical protein